MMMQKLVKSVVITSLAHFYNTKLKIHCMSQCISTLVSNIDSYKLTDFEKSNNSKEWYYVERSLPLKLVPLPKNFDGYGPSGWISPQKEARLHPYFISRTKNYMIPVYLNISHRGSKHVTLVKKIEGNIWKLEDDLKEYLKTKIKKYKNIPSLVNEMTGQIRFKGDHVEYVYKWIISKGF